MREVGRFYDAEEAQVAAAYLRSLGFEVALPEEYHLGAAPHLSFGLGGYRILADDRDAFLAKAALDEKRPQPKHDACPQCGSGKIRRTREWWFTALINAVFGPSFPFSRARTTLVCRTCGLTRKDETDEPSDHV
jgi:hypothetical protein